MGFGVEEALPGAGVPDAVDPRDPVVEVVDVGEAWHPVRSRTAARSTLAATGAERRAPGITRRLRRAGRGVRMRKASDGGGRWRVGTRIARPGAE